MKLGYDLVLIFFILPVMTIEMEILYRNIVPHNILLLLASIAVLAGWGGYIEYIRPAKRELDKIFTRILPCRSHQLYLGMPLTFERNKVFSVECKTCGAEWRAYFISNKIEIVLKNPGNNSNISKYAGKKFPAEFWINLSKKDDTDYNDKLEAAS